MGVELNSTGVLLHYALRSWKAQHPKVKIVGGYKRKKTLTHKIRRRQFEVHLRNSLALV